MKYDILIKNIMVVDGSGEKAYKADVAVDNGKIVKIGQIDGDADKVISGENKILSPGFIDSHGHTDLTIIFDPSNHYKLEQGVTTEVSGCCGESYFPVSEDKYDEYIAANELTDFERFKTDFNPREYTSGKKWFDYVHSLKLGTNMIMLVGHGMIRASVMGYENREATPEELELMKDKLREAMEAGASGMSTGIAYAPGVFTPENEIIELCKVVAEYDGFYSTHMRNQGVNLLESVEETLRVTRATGVKTVISHLKAIGKPNWGKIKEVRKVIDKAILEEKLPVTWDSYPYVAGSTTLKITLPPSVLDGGDKKLVERVSKEEYREYIKNQINNPTEKWENAIGNNGFESILVLDAPNTPDANGKTLKEYAEYKNADPFDVYFDLIKENMVDADVQTINFVMCEEDLVDAISCPYSLVGSDGLIITEKMPVHPRGKGTFTRYLGRYVRDKKILSMEEGIRKITGCAADFYNLKTKGYIKEGYDADLVIIDYDKVIDHADFTDCYRDNEGIETVILAGEVVVENGKCNGVAKGGVVKNTNI